MAGPKCQRAGRPTLRPAFPIFPRAIRRAWDLSGQRYRLPRDKAVAALGPWALADDWPASPGTVTAFDGLAAAPLLRHFGKVIFCAQPGAAAGEGSEGAVGGRGAGDEGCTERLYGRVLLPLPTVSDRLYPLYFKVSLGPVAVDGGTGGRGEGGGWGGGGNGGRELGRCGWE